MARQPTPNRNRPSRQLASSALAKKHPQRNTDTRRCLLDFHTDNAFIYRHRETQGASSGTWEHPDIENAIAHLEKAVANTAFPLLDELPRCRILTLLGNRYKSIAEYTELPALASQKTTFLKVNCANLADATADNARYYGDEQCKQYFLAEREKTEATLISDDAALTDTITSGKNAKTGKGKPYRKWCAENTLCLTPYNDLGTGTAASGDLPECTNTEAPGIATPTGGNPAEGLAAPFADSTNCPLRGLFCLSNSLPPERHLNTIKPDSILWKTVAASCNLYPSHPAARPK